jgi:Uma2 family endonuclease
MAVPLPRHQFTVDEYQRMVESGGFADMRVELIEGEIVDMSPIGLRHAFRVASLTTLFGERLGRAVFIWSQSSIRLADRSQPEPDIALLRPPRERYQDNAPGPNDILLLIEVADSSVDYAFHVKAPLYARNGIREYWLVNLIEGHVVAYRDPSPDGYRTAHVARPGDEIRPLAFPKLAVAVVEILG